MNEHVYTNKILVMKFEYIVSLYFCEFVFDDSQNSSNNNLGIK